MRKFRNHRRDSFTILTNEAIDDPMLNLVDLGLLASYLRYSDGWPVSLEVIYQKHNSGDGRRGGGRKAIRASFQNLRAQGYIFSFKWRTPAGHWHTGVAVYPSPATEEEIRRVISVETPSDARDIRYEAPHLGLTFSLSPQVSPDALKGNRTNSDTDEVAKDGTDQHDWPSAQKNEETAGQHRVSPKGQSVATEVPLRDGRLSDRRLEAPLNKKRGKTTERSLTPLPPAPSAGAPETTGQGGAGEDASVPTSGEHDPQKNNSENHVHVSDVRDYVPSPEELAEASRQLVLGAGKMRREQEERDRAGDRDAEKEARLRAEEVSRRQREARAYMIKNLSCADHTALDALRLVCLLPDPPEVSGIGALVSLVDERLRAGDTVEWVEDLLVTTDRAAWEVVLGGRVVRDSEMPFVSVPEGEEDDGDSSCAEELSA